LRGTGLESRAIDPTTFVLQADPPADQVDPPQAPPPPPKPQTLKTIEVTGSHIRAAQLATANPVVAVTAQQLQQTGELTIGQALLNLPSVTGAVVTPNFDNQGVSGTGGGTPRADAGTHLGVG